MNEQTETINDNIVLYKGANSLEIRIAFPTDGSYSLQCTLYTASNSGCSKLTFVSPWDNSGNLSFTITAPRPTVYGVGVKSKTERPGRSTITGTPDVSYNVYVDGEYYTTRWTISHPSVGIPIDPWFGKVYLNSGHTPTERVSLNNAVSASAKKGDENLCTAIIGNLEKDYLTTTITKGSEYLSFYDAVNGTTLIGDSFNESINGLYATLKYDTPYYGTEDYQTEITTEVNGYTKSAAFKLIPEECGTGTPECDVETEAPELKVTTHPVGTFNQNKCILVRDSNNPAIIIKHTLGVTSPVQGSKMFNPYIPDVCFNVSANSWHFNVKTFEMNIIMGLCNDNIDLLDYKVINSFYDLEQIPTENICNALKALYGHYVYPYDVYPGDYIFTEIILKHEQTHVNEIKEIFSMYLPNFKNDFKKIILTCSDVQNETDARNQGRQEISKIFNKYMQQSLDIYNYKGKSDDEKDELKLRNEIKTNMNEEVFNLQVAYSLWLEQKALNLGLNCN